MDHEISTGQFAKGNMLGVKYKTEEAFLEKAQEYLEWAANTPIEMECTELVNGKPVHYKSRKNRLPTLIGLQVHLGISDAQLQRWLNGTACPHLYDAANMIRDVIRTAQLELGASGAVNSAFTAKIANLVERSETTVTDNSNPENQIDPLDIPNLVHPDAPLEDQLSDTPLLFSKCQIDGGVPYPMKVINAEPNE